MNLFNQLSQQCSKATTEKYSTSFSRAIKLLHHDLRGPIYNIYGFVRFADEIVDTFHQYQKEELLTDFKKDAFKAIEKAKQFYLSLLRSLYPQYRRSFFAG